jgi:8-oxo-dGTP pyrophosphatase MutT (NUDIX family)
MINSEQSYKRSTSARHGACRNIYEGYQIKTPDIQTWSDWRRQAPRKSVAVGAVVQKDLSLLFVRHNYGLLRGQWSFPTGFAEPFESPDVTALREVKEEGGIIAAVGLRTAYSKNNIRFCGLST